MGQTPIRWRTAEEGESQGEFFGAEELVDRHVGRGEYRGLEFLHVNAKRIINEVPKASRLPFRYTINAYRGCSHACTYCFARTTHEYLGLDAGGDFDTKIVVKVNAVERLRADLAGRRWAGEHIAMGTNTDPYQRCEGRYRLTRGIIGVLAEAANPFSILTKSTLILRDLDLLVEASRRTAVRVNFSVGTLDDAVWKSTEPGTPHPRRRVEAVRRLNEAGVACGVLVAPILPAMSDSPEQLEEVVEACASAGAVSISAIALHLRPGVREHFLDWLERERPDLVPLYRRRYRRAYLPASDQKALAGQVGALVGRAESRFVGPRSVRLASPRPDDAGPEAPGAAPPRSAAPAAEQLALPL